MTDARLDAVYLTTLVKGTPDARLDAAYLTVLISSAEQIPAAVAATLPSLTAAFAGTSTSDGPLHATLPQLSAALAGTSDDTAYAVTAATLPSLTASLAGTFTDQAVVAATLPHLSAAIAGTFASGPPEAITAVLPLLSADITGTSTPDVVTVASMDLHGGGTLDTTALTAVRLVQGMSMSGGGRLSMRVPKDWDADPRTNAPQWKFVIANAPTLGGELLCQVKVGADPIEEDVEAPTAGTFKPTKNKESSDDASRQPEHDAVEGC